MKKGSETDQIAAIPGTVNCKNCNAEVLDKFCGHCGQPSILPRVNAHYVLHEIQHILHFEKGILYTVKELLIRPGKNVRGFITENRSRLVKPILFLVLTSLVYTVIYSIFHAGEKHLPNELQHTVSGFILQWLEHHAGYANLFMGVFIAGWLKILFKKQSYNFFELLILLCFVMGIGMLFSAVFTLAGGLANIQGLEIWGPWVSMLYCFWAIVQFFNQRKVISYLKVLFAYVLGMISFGVVVTFVGLLIDMLRMMYR